MKKAYGILFYVLFLMTFILLSVDFYLSRHYYEPFIEDFFENPAKYDGVRIGLDGPVLNISQDSFYMGTQKREIKVYYNGLQKPKLGQVSVLARFNKDGTATAIELHVNNYNYLKYIISLFGFAIFVYLFFKEWKLKKWRFYKNA